MSCSSFQQYPICSNHLFQYLATCLSLWGALNLIVAKSPLFCAQKSEELTLYPLVVNFRTEDRLFFWERNSGDFGIIWTRYRIILKQVGKSFETSDCYIINVVSLKRWTHQISFIRLSNLDFFYKTNAKRVVSEAKLCVESKSVQMLDLQWSFTSLLIKNSELPQKWLYFAC